jgi:hypothetical protein
MTRPCMRIGVCTSLTPLALPSSALSCLVLFGCPGSMPNGGRRAPMVLLSTRLTEVRAFRCGWRAGWLVGDRRGGGTVGPWLAGWLAACRHSRLHTCGAHPKNTAASHSTPGSSAQTRSKEPQAGHAYELRLYCQGPLHISITSPSQGGCLRPPPSLQRLLFRVPAGAQSVAAVPPQH